MQLDRSKTVLLAGLLHDIGKVLQRTGASPHDYDAQPMDFSLILPYRRHHYTHQHALFTYLYLNGAVAEKLPESPQFDNIADHLVHFAARHHNAWSLNEQIIAEADAVSSGMERKQVEESDEPPDRDHHITERLSPIFEEVSLLKNQFGGFRFRYPMRAMTPDALFPRKEETFFKGKHAAAAEYEEIWKHFDRDFPDSRHYESFHTYLEKLLSHLETCFWAVPSATYGQGRKVWSDISLFDHLLTTGALAHCIFVYHQERGNLTEANIRDKDAEKYLFINLDASGIQDFIFDITVDAAKGATRMLRARSFYISLLMEGVFRLLCRRLNLTSAHRMIDAGGRSLVLAPNLEGSERILHDVQRETDHFCLEHFQGRLTVNLSSLPASARKLHGDNFSMFLSELNERAQEAKLKKLSAFIGRPKHHQISSFWKDYRPGKGLCPVCGKMQATVLQKGEEEKSYCFWCDRFGHFGRELVRATHLMYEEGYASARETLPVPGGCFRVSRSAPSEKKGGMAWRLESDIESQWPFKPVAQYIPVFHEGDPANPLLSHQDYSTEELRRDAAEGIAENAPKTFHHIALSALRPRVAGDGYHGKQYLAIMKADVDNLGFLFGYGLEGRDGETNRLTLSRYATASRMLDRFFSLYLPNLLRTEQPYSDTYTVYAGGDDLFLIGPWRQTFPLAHRIYEDFRQYTCRNPDVTLSATLNLMKCRHPVNHMAHVAEIGLKKAKEERTDKNSLHLWGDVIPWDAFPAVMKAKDELDGLINDPASKISTGFVHDLLVLKEMKRHFDKEKRLRYGAYPALFRYKMGRLVKERAPEAVKDILLDLYHRFILGNEPLHLSIQWALYLNRK